MDMLPGPITATRLPIEQPKPTTPPTALTTKPATTTQADNITTTQASTTTPPSTKRSDPPALPPFVSIDVVPITSSGTDEVTSIAGESYSLECSVTVTGSTDQPTIIWMDPMNNQITSGVVTTGSMSTLTFNPLAASHAGTYTCRATLGSAMDIASWMVTVQSM